MKGDPYTRGQMDAARAGSEALGGRFDGLHADALSAVTSSANAIKAIRDQYREAFADELARWRELRDETMGHDVGRHQTEIGRLEIALRNLESTRRFLDRGEASLDADAADGAGPDAPELRMRIIEAQEAERSRLAQEVHDGPAQALSNAIFQAEYIERVLGEDPRLAATELRFLRELLRRELGDVRSFISQLRPPVLDELGLEGAIRDAVAHMSTLMGFDIAVDLADSGASLPAPAQTVVLRVVQEALQNARKHASASTATVATRAEADAWYLEVRDDGRGFDVAAVAARGRRNFGLQFMRERAELIGARFDVRSRPDGGTVVRLAIPTATEEHR
jgi:signal transduction histidine kinase